MTNSLHILGNGVMARALALGLKDDYQICVVGRSLDKLQAFQKEGFEVLEYSHFSLDDKNVILAFKPYALSEVSKVIKGEARTLISVLANTSLNALQIAFKAQNYARIMPNTAAEFKASTTPYILANELYKDEILQILQSFGEAFELEKEEQMAAAMAISGCAPAFLALVSEAIANGGVREGLKNELSYKLTSSLFASFAELIKHQHPALIKEGICSPAGVTIEGVKILEQRAVRGAFFEAINASAGKK